MDSIPLTPNGKIDRKALPCVTGEDLIRREYVAPRNEIEEKLVEIWQEVLGVDKVGITDNFFELGGHSLMVAQILNRIHQNLSMRVSFKNFFVFPTIEGITKNLTGKEYTPIPKASQQENYPLAPSQQRLWVLSQLEGGSKAYNMPAVVILRGEFNKAYFKKAFQSLIDRHEILRTSFKSDKGTGEIRQYITPKEEIHFTIEVLDFIDKSESEVEDYLHSANNEAFNLEESPLVRAFLLKRGSEEYLFFLSMHHIIGDGWSTEVLISEVVNNYNKLLKECNKEEGIISSNGEKEKAPLAIQYKDYAVWLQEEIKGDEYRNAEAYWLNQFDGQLPVLELPSYKTRPLIQTYNGNNINHLFSREFTEKLKQYSEKHGVTLFITLMAGIKTLLYRYTGQDDIIVGTPIAGREHPDLENQIGLYLNTLAIRTRLEEHNTFESVLTKEKEILLSAYEHQLYPFDELVSKLNIKRDTSRSALFDVLVVFQNQTQLHLGNTQNNINGLQVEKYGYHRKTSQFDISYMFEEDGGQLSLTIEYNTDIYDDFLIKRMFSHFEKLLRVIVDNSTKEIFIEDIDFLTRKESYELLYEFNDTKIDYPSDKTIVGLFEEQVEKTPRSVAIVFENKELTYWELNEHSNQLGDYLRKSYHIKPDDLVAIKLERSEQMIFVIWGILKSGAAYVPIDPEYPTERIEYIEQDANAKVTIDEAFLKSYQKELEKSENIYTKENVPIISRPDSLVYVIYTSGTTGQPKGVLIENHSLINRLVWMQKAYSLTSEDTLIQKTTYSFDVSVWELLWWGIYGAKLSVLTSKHEKSPFDIIENIYKNKVTVIHFVPSMLMRFLIYLDSNNKFIKKIDSLQQVFVSGEALTIPQRDLFYKILPNTSLINLYGPTEASIDVSYYDCSDFNSGISIPIGKPIDNISLYILDSKLQIKEHGSFGKLYIAGVGLSRGYLNKPELTAEKFIDNPFEEGTKMYDTGDLARWLPDGNIEYLGRNDFQVKIRGYRIELGEVETHINQFNTAIKQVVADAKEVNGEKVLVAYYVKSKEANIDKIELREYLQGKLPEYMVPGFLVELDSIPLTPNGKIDRKALPCVTGEDLIRREYVAPRNEIEEKLVEIWQEVLGVDKVGITDNFFELGGHSLMAIKLTHSINEALKIDINVSQLFEHNTIQKTNNLISTLNLIHNLSHNQHEESESETFTI
ncbi:non-ribosomal peptide synthetase [Chryseobacterium piperi]|uniref:non-ribosomal peptide synthetase n=1 Tax=Chryseobacterium piperi TaxID=558152 RepID=UPI000A01A498|nr:non-ribosomal peptide synthetase [Chryseobacterium piperi]